jgi:porin
MLLSGAGLLSIAAASLSIALPAVAGPPSGLEPLANPSLTAAPSAPENAVVTPSQPPAEGDPPSPPAPIKDRQKTRQVDLLPKPRIGIPASPAAVDKVPGTGALGRWLGLPADSPWRLGGVWVGNGTTQISGGAANPGGLGLAQQFLLDLSLDLEQSLGWRGASVWVQGLQVNANTTASRASGSQQGSNSLVAPPPLDRTELYSFALSQYLFDEQVRVLAGKLSPSNDFANVVVPVAESFGSNYWIPGVSSLTYTPLYAMPTLLGRLPGYPNSALGASILVQPNAFKKMASLKLGLFDGRGGAGVQSPVQTGLVGPSLSGPLFSIAELGGSWLVGNMQMPGAASFGIWHQGGPLGCDGSRGSCAESSAAGGYLIAQQRAINFRYPNDNSGVSAFFQAGWSPSVTNLFTSSIGGGFTVFAPMRSRPLDSYGFGLSWARINDQGPLAGISNASELMLQVYGQFHLVSNLYLTPSLTVLPYVGLKDASAPSTSALLQLVALF